MENQTTNHLPVNIINIRLLAQTDSRNFRVLIQNNKTRLQPWFPLMCRKMTANWKSWLFVRKKLLEYRYGIYFPFVLEHKTTKELIGYISLKTIDHLIPKGELAYFIDGAWEGKGLAGFALQEITKRAFEELQFRSLFVRINAENPASRAVAIKAGFISEGFRENDFQTHDGRMLASEYFGKTKT